jgi:hypothetical protein
MATHAYSYTIAYNDGTTMTKIMTFPVGSNPSEAMVLDAIRQDLGLDDQFQIEIEEVSECSGCREGQANQQAHSDMGGCLYIPEGGFDEVEEFEGGEDGEEDGVGEDQ